jgi:DNA ligase (NAD+)
MDAIAAATVENLVQVEEVGVKIAESVVGYFASETNQKLVSRLKEAGLQMEISPELMAEEGDVLSGKTIVISGTFTTHSRDEYKAMIEKNGGKNAGSVSSKTSFILAGENMGPAKLEKAAALGIELYDEAKFLKLLNK